MAEGDTHTPMSTATAAKAAPASSKSRAQREAEEYLSRIKLKEIFQGLLTHVVVHQPEDPIDYFSKEIGKIKREMEESNVDVSSTTFLTSSSTDRKNK